MPAPGRPGFGPRAATIFLVAAVGAWLLVHALFRHPIGDYGTESDFYGGYAAGARAIQAGRFDIARTTVIGPVYEVALALLGFVVRDLFLAAKLLSVLASIGTLAAWAALGRARLGPWAGLAFAGLVAANPTFLLYSGQATTDALALGTQALALWALLSARDRRSGLAAGALVALAVLTRYTSLYLVPLALLLAALDRESAPTPAAPQATKAKGAKEKVKEKAPRARVRAPYAWALAGALAVLGGWTAFSMSQGTMPGSVLVRSFGYYANPEGTRDIQDAEGYTPGEETPYPSLGDVVTGTSVGAWPARAARAFGEHVVFYAKRLLGPAVTALAAVGMLLALAGGAGRALLPFGLAFALLFAELLPVFTSERYALPLLPLALGGAAAAIGGAARGLPGWLVLAFRLAAVVVFGVSAKTALEVQAESARHLPHDILAAAPVLRAASPPDARVISRKGHLGYYAGRETVPFPRRNTLGELAQWARSRGAGYLYYSWYEARLRPEFIYLLDSTATAPGLTVLQRQAWPPAALFALGPTFGQEPAWWSSDELRAVHGARGFLKVAPAHEAAPAHLILARHLFGRGGPWPEVIEHAIAATLGTEDVDLAWTLAGVAYAEQKKWTEARSALERALAIDRDDPDARRALGWVLLEQGDPAGAAATWRPVVAVTRDVPTLERMLEVYTRQGDRAAAAEARAALGALHASP